MGIDDVDLDQLEERAKVAVAMRPTNWQLIDALAAAVASLRLEASNARVRELRDEELVADLRNTIHQLKAEVTVWRDEVRQVEKDARAEMRDMQRRLDAAEDQDQNF